MINHSTKELHEKLDTARRRLRECTDSDERMILQNYIGNLYQLMECMGDYTTKSSHRKIYGSEREYEKFLDRLDSFTKKELDNFIVNKNFHKQFFKETIIGCEKELGELYSIDFMSDNPIKRKEFVEILYAFFQSIGVENLFDDYYRHKHISSLKKPRTVDGAGCVLINPFTQESDIFIHQLKNDYNSMRTIAHEVGHVYEQQKKPLNSSDYLQHFYCSPYGETIPRMFERLFAHFMIKNQIMPNTTRENMVSFENMNHGYMLTTFLASLIDKESLLNYDYTDWDRDQFIQIASDYLREDADIDMEIQVIQEDGIHSALINAYGGVLSLLLADDVEKYGMNSELFEYFLSKRSELFSEELLRECGFGPGNFNQLFEKEAQLIKK